MNSESYQKALEKLQIELVHLQHWVVERNLKVVVVFEGRDAAGKGGVIKAITDKLNPRVVKIAALGKPSDREKGQWYFQRYVAQFPAAGEIVLFDRSWYNRAGVEKVMGFCSDEEYQYFLESCPVFEKMLIDSGIILLKYWFSVSDEVQEKRFQERLNNPLKRWKFSDMDLEARNRWHQYSTAKDKMFKHTDTKVSPWFVVNANNKKSARLNCIAHMLSQIDYQEMSFHPVQLPELKHSKIKRMPIHKLNWIPEKF